MIIASDDFNRANQNPIAGNWSTSGGTGYVLIISSNKVITSTDQANDAWAHYSAITWPNDQYSEVKVTTTSTSTDGSGGGVCVRKSTTNATKTQYRLVVSTTRIELSKFNGNGFTALYSAAITFTSGSKLRLSASGQILRIYNNGAFVTSVTDSLIASGSAGLSYSSTDASYSLDDWEGGDLRMPPNINVQQAVKNAAYY